MPLFEYTLNTQMALVILNLSQTELFSIIWFSVVLETLMMMHSIMEDHKAVHDSKRH